jgi:hypothetical protein
MALIIILGGHKDFLMKECPVCLGENLTSKIMCLTCFNLYSEISPGILKGTWAATMTKDAKRRAEVLNREFNLTTKDLYSLLPPNGYCPVLNKKFSAPDGGKISDYSMTLHRLDSTKGYTKTNVQIISWLANCMFARAKEEDLISFANYILCKDKND